MTIIVTDTGFKQADPAADYHALDDATDNTTVDLQPDAAEADLDQVLSAPMIRIAFPSFADGRGFTLATALRRKGYAGRLRAYGHVLADQYAMARRSGFDDVEIEESLAARQPEPQWLARANWQAHDYQSRLGRIIRFP